MPHAPPADRCGDGIRFHISVVTPDSVRGPPSRTRTVSNQAFRSPQSGPGNSGHRSHTLTRPQIRSEGAGAEHDEVITRLHPTAPPRTERRSRQRQTQPLCASAPLREKNLLHHGDGPERLTPRERRIHAKTRRREGVASAAGTAAFRHGVGMRSPAARPLCVFAPSRDHLADALDRSDPMS